MFRVIKQWVDLNDWVNVLLLQTEGWEIADETNDSVLMIKEI